MGEYDKDRTQDGGATNGQQNQAESTVAQSGAGYGDQGEQAADGQSATGSMGQQGQTDPGMPNDDRDRFNSTQSDNDTGGLTEGQGDRSEQGGMQQDAIDSVEGDEFDDEDDDTLADQDAASNG